MEHQDTGSAAQGIVLAAGLSAPAVLILRPRPVTQPTLEVRTLLDILGLSAAARVKLLSQELVRVLEGKVQNGPFTGMLLPDESSWGFGDVAPKILGCYELELHATIEKAISRAPEIVINVGCAEGYYAVGLARRLPAAKTYAFDIDTKATAVCRAAAERNGVADRLEVRGECRAQDLVDLTRGVKRALIVLDCEGAELALLTPEIVRQLAHCDIIVETHDFMNRTITPTLAKTLSAHHDPEHIREGPRDPAGYPVLRQLSSLDRALVTCEFRPEVMYWFAAWAR